ncbi:efflux RND transporter permease subunit [Chamaesiphon sp. OTE_20_metabat_361]|uniref:efflux RND transporter permease subunit n=1 Tax=Chamaesiphon sp. OTE_20_metabat_361 TaxID=2964689 RepID=UPI00286C6A10|nr:efflux RND transporter permease subunit [Chamaesiphon sp. OTE_20_metabat_361]
MAKQIGVSKHHQLNISLPVTSYCPNSRNKDPKSESLYIYNVTHDRLRSIFMSAGTSILGIVPLAIFPRQRSEFDRRLGIAIAGGLAFSTILTPTVVPALMALLPDFSGDRRKHIIGS